MPAIHQRNLRFALASLLVSFSMPASVFAAENTWQGSYLGVYAGDGFGYQHISSNAGSVSNTSYFTTSADINAVNNAATWSKDPGTIIAGIQAGHDWTWKKLIYGVALDYSTMPLHSSSTKTNTYPDNTDQYSVDTSMHTNWLFTLRGRLGYQAPLCMPNLFYVTGGMAITQLKTSNQFSDNSALLGSGSSSASQNQIGFTTGAGVELMLRDHVSVDFEYLYVGVPSVKTTASISNQAGGFGIPAQSMTNMFANTAKFHANLLKVGMNYRFDE